MADRRVKVVFSAEIQGFKRAMEEAAQATKKTKTASEESSKAADTYLGKMVQSATMSRDEWEKVGGTMLGVGTAAVAGLALAGKAAMDWESAWAGVTKTVNGTPEQMDELETSLRGLAKTLPATHEEIAGVAEAAGQLGVSREDVTGFTKTMIDLGESTNLSADDAATAIAQISNIMGTMDREGSKGVERFGATLVALGNAGASTEAEIVDMAKRIAGAAKLVGASESDVLALSNAMASVGIESQLGGGVISRVMQRMYADVKAGGKGLDDLAKVAGVSSKDFAKSFESDPVRAVDSMIKGLSRVKNSGGDVIQTMSDLGIKGTEETGVILRLAGAGDLLSDSLKLGDEAWASNSALAAEAAKRYETTESKVKIAWNNIKDAAIDAGAVLLPIIAGAAESVAGLAQSFGALPDPVKGVLTVLGGVAGVAALGAGAFLTLTPKILDSVEAFNKLAPAGGKARGVLAGVGKAAGAAGAIATVTLILAKLAEADYMSKIDTGMGKVALALADVTSNSPGAASALDGLFKDRDGGDLINTVTDLDSAIKRTFNKDPGQAFNDWGEGIINGMTGIEGSSQILEGSFKRLDTGLADLVGSGKSDDAAKAFDKIKEAAKSQNVSVEELVKKFPEYADALKQAEANAKGAGEGGDAAAAGIKAAGDASETAALQTEEVQKALEDAGIAADGTIVSLDKLVTSMQAAGLISISADQAAINYQKSLEKVDEVIARNGKTMDITTKAGKENKEAWLDQASAANAANEANAKNGVTAADLNVSLTDQYGKLKDNAIAMGASAEQADLMARNALGIPKDVKIETAIQNYADTMAKAAAIKAAVDGITSVKTIFFQTDATGFYDPTAGTNGAGAGTGGKRKGPGAFATGGRLPAFADGGQLPTSGPGTGTTDGFLGVSSAGVPLARVDAGEWIINGRSSSTYNRELAAINAGTFPKLPGFANGGRAYAAQAFASRAGGSAGITFDFSGAQFTALDPVQLRRDIVDDVTYKINSKGGVRIV